MRRMFSNCYAATGILWLLALAPAGLAAEEFAGTITRTDPDTGTVTLAAAPSSDPVTLKVAGGDAVIYEEGARIRGERDGDWLRNIWPAGKRDEAIMEAAARSLRADTVRRGRGVFRSLGERLPNFALYNQAGEVVNSRDLRGTDTVINFIFTRCTQPEMCPLSTKKMAEMQDMAEERNIGDLRFVTITFDPAFDTPGRLHAYAEAYGIDTANYDFLTGPDKVIADLMKQLGVLRMSDETLIWNHTLATILVAPDGSLYYRVPNSRWSPEDFLNQIEKRRQNANDPA